MVPRIPSALSESRARLWPLGKVWFQGSFDENSFQGFSVGFFIEFL